MQSELNDSGYKSRDRVGGNIPELEQLNQVRLDMDLTWRALGAAIGLTGQGAYRLLTHRRPNPLDRTLHRIRKFLAEVEG